MSPTVRAAVKRLGITFVISMVFAFAIAEISYQMVKNQSERAPRQIEILIPPGTASQIANGNRLALIAEVHRIYIGVGALTAWLSQRVPGLPVRSGWPRSG